MATCLDIVTYAMRLSRILPMGDEPNSDEGAAGLAALQSLYDQWRTSGMFGELEDVYLDGDDVAEEGVRYFVPTGYTLPPLPAFTSTSTASPASPATSRSTRR
jgi:hypothetical protein